MLAPTLSEKVMYEGLILKSQSHNFSDEISFIGQVCVKMHIDILQEYHHIWMLPTGDNVYGTP